VRPDTTPQVARIDAHLLNRSGVARLCYCGPVLHTRPDRPHATREPLQFGAELYGHAGLEADLEVLQLALDSVRAAGVRDVTVDLADARVVRALLAGLKPGDERLAQVHAALAAKDVSELKALAARLDELPAAARDGVVALAGLYGDARVLDEAQRVLPPSATLTQALSELRWLASHLPAQFSNVTVRFDLADLRGYAYYSGIRFGLYVPGGSDALVRGGRYDEVGAVFGRNRPAVGFSLDLRELVAAVPARAPRAAIRAPWGESAELRAAIASLRAQGETVVCVLPGHEQEIDEFECDRELVQQADRWMVRAL
jgi:ATP phosphoribosyltransferase regulatory subunit